MRPYICTDAQCELNMFESQHDWFEHEVNFHRKLWECKICKDRLPRSKPELSSHLQDHHAGTDESLDPQNVESWRKSKIDATECPLCCTLAEKLKAANDSEKCEVTLKTFQSHLGGHFEQLAFAALPNDVEDVVETTEDLSSDDEYSDKIDSTSVIDESFKPDEKVEDKKEEDDSHLPGIQFGVSSAISTHSGRSPTLPSNKSKCEECEAMRRAGHRNARKPKYCAKRE